MKDRLSVAWRWHLTRCWSLTSRMWRKNQREMRFSWITMERVTKGLLVFQGMFTGTGFQFFRGTDWSIRPPCLSINVFVFFGRRHFVSNVFVSTVRKGESESWRWHSHRVAMCRRRTDPLFICVWLPYRRDAVRPVHWLVRPLMSRVAWQYSMLL